MTTVHFGCHKCGVHFPSLNLAEQHLRQTHAETLEEIEKFDNGSYSAAPLMLLFSFECYTETAHAAAIAHARMHAVAISAPQRKRPTPAETATEPKRGRLDPSVVDNPTRTQSVSDSANVTDASNNPTKILAAPITSTVFPAPITVRVTLHPHSPGQGKEIFTFPFVRDKHTTVKKLLDAVAASYSLEHGKPMVNLQHRPMQMHFTKKGARQLGGPVFDDGDLQCLGDVEGLGWFGRLVFD